jgi:hypothetical protein
MRAPGEIPADAFVYRRVPRQHWHSIEPGDGPKAKAFLDRHQRLSVYLADAQSPRGALDLAIRHGSPVFLEREGRSVEELVARGWRVVRVPLAAFLAAGLVFDRVEDDGHVELCGDPTASIDDLIELAEVLSPAECLAWG